MWCDFGATLYQTILTILTISNSTFKTRRDKNIVPLAHIKTHLSRWVFVFISWEQWNESASQILEMTCRSWNSLTRMKCTAVHKDSFYFTICRAYHFKTALPSFQVRKANISFFPALLYNFRAHRTCNTEITSKSCVHIFKEYKAKMAEAIKHDLLWSKRAVQFVKNWAVLFTF